MSGYFQCRTNCDLPASSLMRRLLFFCASELSKFSATPNGVSRLWYKISRFEKSQSRQSPQNKTKQTENVKKSKSVDLWMIFKEEIRQSLFSFFLSCTVLLAIWRVFCKAFQNHKRRKIHQNYINMLFQSFYWPLEIFFNEN